MPNVWMDEIERVDSVGSGGRTVSPAVPVDAGDSISENGRDVHADPKNPKIPNPGPAEDGQVIITEDGSYVLGEGGSGGGSGGILVVCADEDFTILDKTWQEIYDAGYAVLKSVDGEITEYTGLKQIAYNPDSDSSCSVIFGRAIFTCEDPDDYPHYTGRT